MAGELLSSVKTVSDARVAGKISIPIRGFNARRPSRIPLMSRESGGERNGRTPARVAEYEWAGSAIFVDALILSYY
ncbi:MAG: hypothetical protein ACLFM0_10495 [Spirochaetales bacterium]